MLLRNKRTQRKRRLVLLVAFFLVNCYFWFNTIGFSRRNNSVGYTNNIIYGISTARSFNNTTNRAQVTTVTNSKVDSDGDSHEIDTSLLQLKVPFYVYDDDHELNWLSKHDNATATFDGQPLPYHAFQTLRGYKKHSDDYWLLVSAMKHPMRTFDIEQAKLVFVPTLLNLLSAILFNQEQRKLCFGSSSMNIKDGTFSKKTKCYDGVQKRWFQTISDLDDMLGRSMDNHSDKQHVIVASHFTSRHYLDIWNVQRCHQFIFETKDVASATSNNPPSSPSSTTTHNISNSDTSMITTPTTTIRIPSMYIGNPCPRSSHKTYDFALIAQMLEDDKSNSRYPLFQSRRDICSWLEQGNYSVSHCGSGVEQCSHLPNARYGFHVKGDSWGSNRLMDILQSSTVPLFTNEEQYEILPNILPWKGLSYLINVSSFDEFQLSMEKLLSLPEADYEEKLRLIQRHQHILDPAKVYQFDRLMTLLATRLGFQ